MGLLTTQGSPMAWEQSKAYCDHVRKHGIKQFLAIYERLKDRTKDVLLWGDEVEYVLVKFDDKDKHVVLSLRAKELLDELMKEEHEHPDTVRMLWRPEYARYMLEATPGFPYGGTLRDFVRVEPNMRLRRKTVEALLGEGESIMSLTSYPRLGAGRFLAADPATGRVPEPYGPAARSLFVPDECINQHPRFPTLTQNIRTRRGSRVAINMPVFRDRDTRRPFVETFANDDGEARAHALPDHIYMDCMCFGMGCCCLQMTFQACNIREARYMYDQLATVAPIVLALSAAAPVFRGLLADVDCRWNVISGSVDDRTEEERGLAPLDKSRYQINKSRYDSIDSYLSTDRNNYAARYNDLDLVFDADVKRELQENGIDQLLAQHVAHLFIRDPLVIFDKRLDLDDAHESDHFENIQSTNWQTVRFKPPPPDSDIGWRVEFRSTEVQLTDFENAAFVVFIALLTRVILSFNLNLYVPISKVDENMQTAHRRDAVRQELFYFRSELSDDPSSLPAACSANVRACASASRCDGPAGARGAGCAEELASQYEPMSVDTIINGKSGVFPGLAPLMHAYLDTMNVDVETRCQFNRYLQLIQDRAAGKLLTTAAWMRQFVQQHPKYQNDSVVSEEINYDLMKACDAIGKGERHEPTLLGSNRVEK